MKFTGHIGQAKIFPAVIIDIGLDPGKERVLIQRRTFLEGQPEHKEKGIQDLI